MAVSSLSSGSPLPFVGRAREIDRLARCLNQARAGQGTTVLVSGEAGIGKTSLVNRIGAGTLALTGHCYDYAAAPPYGPWLEILDDDRLARRKLISQVPFDEREADGSLQDQRELFNAVYRLLVDIAEAQPLTLIFEDLHWADAGTIDLLRATIRRIQSHPVLIVVTYRDDELTRDHPLYRTLPYLNREAGAERIHLQRLPVNCADELVRLRYDLADEDRARLVDYLHLRAQGTHSSPWKCSMTLRSGKSYTKPTPAGG